MALPRLWPALIFVVTIQLHIAADSVYAQPAPAVCSTGDNRPGRCVRLRSCQSLQRAAKQATELSELVALFAYVRRSLCGYDGNGLLVCCTDGVSAASIATGSNFEPFTFRPLVSTASSYRPVTSVQPLQPPVTGAPPATDTTACGLSNFTQTRVVGGVNAKLNAYPWIGILAYQLEPNELPKYLCASSLVSQRYVLTTAHCVRDELVYVRLGEYDLASDTDGATPMNVPIVEPIVHPEYVANLILNDIALLRLAFDVPISVQIRPICLPYAEPLRSADLTGYHPFLAGWGSASYQGTAPSILQEAQVPIVSNAQCERNYRQLFAQQTFDERTLCAGEGGRDACQGDSGGPLMMPQQVPADGTFYYVLIGLVSYGYECAREGFPGVYTRVAAFMPWIQQNMV